MSDLEAVIEDPEGHQIIADVIKNDDGSASVAYTPIVGGTHTVVIKKGEGLFFIDFLSLFLLSNQMKQK